MPDSNQLALRTRKLADNINQEIYEQRKGLLGRVLTIVDTAIADPEQRKATKNLVNDVFYRESYWEGPRYQFEMFAEAGGFKLHSENPEQVVPQGPANPFTNL
jgi:hypothetical protein